MSDSDLRDKLLELETVTPELEAQYRKQMDALLERPLTLGTRIGLVVGVFMGIGFLILFSGCAIAVTWLEPGFPLLGRIMFAGGGLFGLAWAIYCFVVLRKGSFNLDLWRSETFRQFRTVSPAAFGITWTFLVLMTVGSLLMGSQMEDHVRGIQMVLNALVFLVLFGLPLMILSSATESELLVREKFLQLELHLAELRELMAAQRADDSRDSSHGAC